MPLEVGRWRLPTDPTFGLLEHRSHCGWGMASRKVARPAISAHAIGPIDAVLLTHDHHANNLDAAEHPLLAAMAPLVTPSSGRRG